MLQFSYSTGAVSELVKNPQDRTAVGRSLVEAVGGKLESFYYAFGEYDAVAEAYRNLTAPPLLGCRGG